MSRLQFLLSLVILLLLIVSFVSPTLCASPELTPTEIQRIRGNIQKSFEQSEKAVELFKKAQNYGRVSSQNFNRTRINGFQQAHELCRQAEEKFRQARAHFGDAWLKMQWGFDERDREAIREAESHYNPGIKLYNEGAHLYARGTSVGCRERRTAHNNSRSAGGGGASWVSDNDLLKPGL